MLTQSLGVPSWLQGLRVEPLFVCFSRVVGLTIELSMSTFGGWLTGFGVEGRIKWLMWGSCDRVWLVFEGSRDVIGPRRAGLTRCSSLCWGKGSRLDVGRSVVAEN